MLKNPSLTRQDSVDTVDPLTRFRHSDGHIDFTRGAHVGSWWLHKSLKNSLLDLLLFLPFTVFYF